MSARWFLGLVPLSVLIVIQIVACSAGLSGSTDGPPQDQGAQESDAAVAEEAPEAGAEDGEEAEATATLYIMSQCPHCASAVTSLAPLARLIGPRFRLDVEYLGDVVDGQLESSHGVEEILGDMVEICVHENASYERWLTFIECYHRNWRDIPAGWQECSRRIELNPSVIASCVEGSRGAELLAASFERANELGVDTTPTLVVGELVIVGSRPASLLDQVVCGQFAEPLPQPCQLVDPLAYVPVTFITDERCTDPRCDISDVRATIRNMIWGAEVRELDVQSEPGQGIFRSLGLKRLPAVIIGSELEDDREAFRYLKQLRRSGEAYVQSLGRYDPGEGRWMDRLEISVTVLNDERCPEEDCDTERFAESLEEALPTLKIQNHDYRSKAGKTLYKRLAPLITDGSLKLPAALFSETITDDEEVFGQLTPDLVKAGDDFLLVLGQWDPTAEICDNGVDDDGDRQADCRDSDCRDLPICRPDEQGRLELFTMSQCPYAAMVVKTMGPVVEHFSRQRSKLDFRVQFIGEVGEDGELYSLHGPEEVDEDLRMICAQHHYQKGYAFLDYIICRSENPRSFDWQQCVAPPLKAKVIQKCAEGPQGKRLLTKSYELAEAVGKGSSPSWLLNNRFEMKGRTASKIVAGFCERNQLSECNDEVDGSSDPQVVDGGCSQ